MDKEEIKLISLELILKQFNKIKMLNQMETN